MFKSQQSVEAEKQGTLFKISKRKLPPAERVGMLQEKLYCKAKQELRQKVTVKACNEDYRKAVCRKTARTD